MIAIRLPDSAWEDVELGTEALLEEWTVPVGATVKAGQTVAIVVMVKTSVEVVAPVEGVLEQILIPAGDTIARDQPLANLKAAS
ncbi:MAG: biotin/lipoyl attachment [Massilia sp.]|jgi:pyruvate/2-oxoglutarate dehydrogenase complex dihydrolipoamide acyltransferase (E2) component|nr:biotin/lipoyl attachment [Massilia sp.]